MAIRIPFPMEEPPQVELLTLPLTELALSLHTVVDPKRPVRFAPFARRVRGRLPKAVSRELDDLSFLLGPPAPAPFAFPVRAEPIADALARVAPGDEDVQWTFSMHLDHPMPEHEGHEDVIDELKRDPAATAERFITLLCDYWTHAFSYEWPSVEAKLALARVDAELTLARAGVGGLLGSTTKRARLTREGIQVTPTIPAEIDVALQEDNTLPIVLSLFSAPWVITRIAPAAGLVLPAPDADGRVAAPSLELVQELDAIADATRLTLLRLVADRPRSTRELSELLSLSEAGVSKHLKRLAEAGLVLGERRGYYVMYRLIPGRALAASHALLDFLRLATDSPRG